MELIVPFTDPKEFVKETDRELLSSRIVHCFKQGGRSGWGLPLKNRLKSKYVI